MAESLFDQLKKSGLVSEQKAKQAKKAKGKAQFQQTKQSKAQKSQEALPSASDDPVARAAEEKAERARQLNLERQQQLAKKAMQAEVRQIIESNRLSGYEGSVRYHFADNGTVKTLGVNHQTHQRLGCAQVRIARFDGGYALIPAIAAEKIEQRDPDVLIAVPQAEAALSKEEKDYYAQFDVPDDLMW
ncbi:DUF2058 domain-containing protein [Halothiobacillus neapolitanus]|jgi:uncharacterized protein YaiL (DUF2058 family)|uniref:Nucleoprotein/polynucleotide-associated enzyme n=1 Tax=Halothiobacillus neapolitanus (strain ATCC 23641 / DSM 15147 / CIP 104769 / NCIMB 8539 / c2) TaxID=555778 RepID=D0KWD5_HALNC|nr:DUF2058 domain-containing protein [Halothiobacillus neapolitanus]ACX97038.1 Protein of unknown function DUF2058 [Halothiobacillus neapolitanus c2]OZB75282.1 MAG: hypothetical protein B7X37_02815 [Halothiobacillus sp. 14-55-98]TDN59745.1 hypothetical protein C8D83_10530 [Halothiobacillus neapolitanus]